MAGKYTFEGELCDFGMLIVLEEGFMREFEGEIEGDVVESALVWLCGWRN